MAYTQVTKGVQTYEKKGRKVIKPTPTTLPKPLDVPIQQERVPEIKELVQELKCLAGMAIYSLRSADDIYKLVRSLAEATKAVATLSALDRVEDLTPDMLKDMSSEDLRKYVMKQLDALN